MPRRTKKPKNKGPEKMTASFFLDLIIHRKQIKPVQRAELLAWFKDHKLNYATEKDYQDLLAKY